MGASCMGSEYGNREHQNILFSCFINDQSDIGSQSYSSKIYCSIYITIGIFIKRFRILSSELIRTRHEFLVSRSTKTNGPKCPSPTHIHHKLQPKKRVGFSTSFRRSRSSVLSCIPLSASVSSAAVIPWIPPSS